MVKGVLLGIAGAIVGALLVAYVAVTAGLVPANADGRPGSMERWAARTSLGVAVARGSSSLTNPLQADDDTLIAGIKSYGQHCAICHGDSTGRPTYVGFGLYQHAPTLGHHGVEDDPDAETYWKITHGIRFTGMPSFSRTLSDEQRWQLATFLKHMDKLPARAQAAWKAVKAPAVPSSLLPATRN